MKRLSMLMLVLVTVFMLVACSAGPDRQPAIDAYNQASEDFNAAATLINENIELVDPALVDQCNEISDLLTTAAEKLEGEDELAQENLDELLAWFTDVSEWSVATVDEIETGLAQLG